MTAASEVRILDQRTPQERDRPFLPGMGRTWLLPLYDAFTGLAGVRALHERAVEIAGIAPGEAVLDVGCGTGNLSFAVLAAQPEARVTGLDPDAAALRRAARKARRRGVSLTLVQGYADRLPWLTEHNPHVGEEGDAAATATTEPNGADPAPWPAQGTTKPRSEDRGPVARARGGS